MKVKQIIPLTLALLLVFPGVFAMSQGEANEKVDELIGSAKDYQNLIERDENKIEYLMNLLDISSFSQTFRALYKSDGYKSYLKPKCGVKYKGTNRGFVDMYLVPPEPVCGNGILEGTEECDDGNLIDDDECSNICEIVEVS